MAESRRSVPKPRISKVPSPEPLVILRPTQGCEVLSLRCDAHPVILFAATFLSGSFYCGTNPGNLLASQLLMAGTPSMGRLEIETTLEKIGAIVEISSNREFSTISLDCLSKNFSGALDFLSQVILEPSFPEDEFLVSRGILTNRCRQRMAKNDSLCRSLAHEKLFGPSHPFGIVHTPELVEGVKLEDVRSYYQQQFFSKPKFLISGKFDDSHLEALVRFFQKLPEVERKVASYPTKPSYKEYYVKRKDSKQISLKFLSFCIGHDHDDIHKLHIANIMLGGFFGSRLMQRVREKMGLTYGIHSFIARRRSMSFWSLECESSLEKMNMAKEAILEEIQKMAQTPVSKKELETLKKFLLGKLLFSTSDLFKRSSLYGSLFLLGKDESYLKDYQHAIQSCEAQDLSQMIQEHIVTPPRVEVIVGP